jgi:hypothetical protein
MILVERHSDGFFLLIKSNRARRAIAKFFSDGDDQLISGDSADKRLSSDALAGLSNCKSSTQAKKLLEKGLPDNSLYGSVKIPPGASSRGISDGDLAIQTRLVNKKYSIMELVELSGDRDADRAALATLCITTGSFLSALVVNQNLPGPEIIRFLLVWLLSFAPLAFVGYGIADVDKIQTLLVSVQRSLFPIFRQRMIQHEAGHFLMGHLLGWPIQGYSANAVKNAVEFYPLSDPDRGRDRAEKLGFVTSPRKSDGVIPILEDAPFFSKGGRGGEFIEQRSVFRDRNTTRLQLSERNDPSRSWPYRGFDDATLDQLAVISVAGVCAEILAFGNAEGGVADLQQLRGIIQSAESEMSERDEQNLLRFSLGFTMSQLRRHLGALDALANVMEQDGSIEDCVLAIETCDNASGQDGILGDYELRRREAFRSEGVGLIERLALGGDRNADTEKDSLVEGIGGGYKKESFRLTGDDPLYAALAVSFVFVVWASSGGITLH